MLVLTADKGRVNKGTRMLYPKDTTMNHEFDGQGNRIKRRGRVERCQLRLDLKTREY